jgi:hypothetical protein
MNRCVLGAIALAAAAGAAQAQPGGQFFSTGGMVHVEILPSTAGFSSELHLYSPGGDTFIGLNSDVGLTADLGPFTLGDELIFGIFVRDTGDTFVMGPGSRNADGVPHNVITPISLTSYDVGFEDLFGGGDLDYDDNNFRFTGQLVPAPGGLTLLGVGALGLRRRRRA